LLHPEQVENFVIFSETIFSHGIVLLQATFLEKLLDIRVAAFFLFKTHPEW
jgi:hypothetical protein